MARFGLAGRGKARQARRPRTNTGSLLKYLQAGFTDYKLGLIIRLQSRKNQEMTMHLNDITIEGVTADLLLLSTDEMLEMIGLLKTELHNRAKSELAEIDRRRNSLLELMGEAPTPAPQDDKPPRSRGLVNPPKYRNPDNPLQVWSGRGKRPNWVIQHLTEPANLLQDLLIP
jgi:DNA-binding protein H-NS